MGSSPALRRVTPFLAAWCAGTFAVLLLGLVVGARTSAFGGYEDEPAHLVSGRMIGDWLRAGAPADPVGFAQETYRHLPKVAVGQWPPGWHLALGLWTASLGLGRGTLLLLPALLTGALLALVARRAARDGPLSGLAVAVLVLAHLELQSGALSLMTEVPLTLVSLLTLGVWGRYLDRGRVRDAWGAAALAAAGLSIKGSALALAPACLLAAWSAGRLDRLRRPAPWLAALTAGGVLLPWYAWTLSATADTWEGGARPNLEYVLRALRLYGRWTLAAWGPLLLGLALAGLVAGSGARREEDALPATTSTERALGQGWLLGWTLLHVLVPSSVEERHTVLLVPLLALFAVRAAGRLAVRLVRAPGAARASLVLGLTLAPLLLQGVLGGRPWLTTRRYEGYGLAMAEALGAATVNRRVLVVSDARGEGMLVAEAALLLEHGDPGAVLRASKTLAHGNWLGSDVRRRFEDPSDLQAWLDAVGVQVVLVDHGLAAHQRYEHVDQVLELLRSGSGGWVLDSARDARRGEQVVPGGLECWVRPLDPAQQGELPPFEDLR